MLSRLTLDSWIQASLPAVWIFGTRDMYHKEWFYKLQFWDKLDHLPCPQGQVGLLFVPSLRSDSQRPYMFLNCDPSSLLLHISGTLRISSLCFKLKKQEHSQLNSASAFTSTLPKCSYWKWTSFRLSSSAWEKCLSSFPGISEKPSALENIMGSGETHSWVSEAGESTGCCNPVGLVLWEREASVSGEVRGGSCTQSALSYPWEDIGKLDDSQGGRK